MHRVQRVPATEASGRIHTSTATVAVLPEAEDVDIQINEKDLRIDTFCSSGPGGQSVNTTYSAVRLTHIPTGVVVSQQDEKSQIKNRAKAMKVLRARLYEMEMQKQQDAIAKERRGQVGTGDRSEKIRTYNFRESRITDHRINFTTHQLHDVLEGDMGELLDQAASFYNAEKLKQAIARRSVNCPDASREARRGAGSAGLRRHRARRSRHRRRRCSRARFSAGIACALLTERSSTLRHRRSSRGSLNGSRAASRREPTAYIVGVREFWGLDFAVTPAVLIPRPETEFIVEEALELLSSFALDAPQVADIGTGCGNIAVSLAHEVRGARVTATDVSREALAIASGNATRYGVDDRIEFVADVVSGRRSKTRSTSSPPIRRTSRTPTSRRSPPTCATSRTWRSSGDRAACATSRRCSTPRSAACVRAAGW